MQYSSKRRVTLRGALLGLLALAVATPALAAVIVQNFLEVEVTTATACFHKAAGADDASDYATVDLTSTFTTPEGVDVLREKLSVTAFDGDRTIYSDLVRYENNCTQDIRITLTYESTQGAWADVSAKIFLSTTSDAVGGAAPVATLPGGVGWDNNPIVVDATGTATTLATSTVTLSPGQELQGGVILDASDGVIGTTASVFYVASAELV